MSDQPRRFSDEEFALVLRRAMELQDGGPAGRAGAPDGLTLEDIKAIARDVGVDPSLVDQAVAFLPEGGESTLDRVLGGPTRYRLEHSVDHAAGEDDLARAVDAIRRETGHHGKVSSELGGITWETDGEPSQLHVDLTPRGDGTEVRLSVNRDAAFILTWFFSVAGGLVAGGVTGAVVQPDTLLGGLAIMGGTVTGGLALARTLWGRSTRVVRARVERLMEAVVGNLGGESED